MGALSASVCSSALDASGQGAVNNQICAADEARSGACKKNRCIGHFLGCTHSAGWVEIERHLVQVGIVIPDLVPNATLKISSIPVINDALELEITTEQYEQPN